MTQDTPRFKATLHGQTLGWYDTAEEAQAVLDAVIAAEQSEETDYEYYFTVNDDGEAIVRVVSIENGREVSYSDHSSEDASLADGDGAAFGPTWEDAQRWSKTTREHAETMLRFKLD